MSLRHTRLRKRRFVGFGGAPSSLNRRCFFLSLSFSFCSRIFCAFLSDIVLSPTSAFVTDALGAGTASGTGAELGICEGEAVSKTVGADVRGEEVLGGAVGGDMGDAVLVTIGVVTIGVGAGVGADVGLLVMASAGTESRVS